MKTSEKPALGTSDLFAIAALLAIAIAPLRGAVDFDFINYDDPDYVTENPTVIAGLTSKGVAWAFTSGHASNWHPLTWISHMIDCSLFGMNAGMHHLTSVLLHGANAVLLYLLLRLMTRERHPSALVAALFAVHPLHVESVVWIAERKDVLSATFWLATMLFYSRYSSHRTAINYALVIASFALGLMAKPMLVTLPFVLLLMDFWPLGSFSSEPALLAPAAANKRKGGKANTKPPPPAPCAIPAVGNPPVPLERLIVEKVPLMALAIASSAVTFLVQAKGGSVGSIQAWSLGMRLTNAMASYGIYLFRLLVPIDLAVFYPLPASEPWGACLLSLLAVSAVTALSIASIKSRPFLIVGWLWYLGTLVPVIGLVQIGLQAQADRYTYLPSIGIFIMLAWGGQALLQRTAVPARVGGFVAAAVVAALSVLTWKQAGHWQNDETLFTHATAVTENNYLALNNLGHHYGQAGDFKKAIECYQEALGMTPNKAKIHFNLAHAFEKTGQLEAAVDHYRAAIRAKPNYPLAHFNLAVALAGVGRAAEAAEEYGQELQINPESSDAHNNLGTLLAKKGRFDEAIDHYTTAIRIKPQADNAYSNMAVVLLNQGKAAEAVEACTTALRINPLSADAHNNLGRALEAQGRVAEAIGHYQEALRIDSKHGLAQKNLKNAHERIKAQ
jgi:protein O-mannosyl-transferase